MTILMGTQVIKTVCQSQCLRISKTFVHFLDAPMDIATVCINLTNNFTLQRNTEAHDTMGCWMLRTNVDYIFFFAEEFGFFVFDCPVRVQLYFPGRVKRLFVCHTKRIIFLWVIVFPHRITYPVIAQIKTAHIRMTDESDTIIVEDFTFVEVGYLPYIADRRDFR